MSVQRYRELVDKHELIEDCNLDDCHPATISAVRDDIRLADYDAVVNSITSDLGLPENIRLSLLTKKYCSRGFKEMTTFCFRKGEAGHCAHGFFATRKNFNGKIDIAYSMCTLTFELPPVKLYREKKLKLFGFTINTEQWFEFKERNLSSHQEQKIQLYCKAKAAEEMEKVIILSNAAQFIEPQVLY